MVKVRETASFDQMIPYYSWIIGQDKAKQNIGIYIDTHNPSIVVVTQAKNNRKVIL